MPRSWISVPIGHGVRLGRSIADAELQPRLPSWRKLAGGRRSNCIDVAQRAGMGSLGASRPAPEYPTVAARGWAI
jgi:hypothetical protein